MKLASRTALAAARGERHRGNRPLPLIASVPEIHARVYLSDVLEFRKDSGFNDEPNTAATAISRGRSLLLRRVRPADGDHYRRNEVSGLSALHDTAGDQRPRWHQTAARAGDAALRDDLRYDDAHRRGAAAGGSVRLVAALPAPGADRGVRALRCWHARRWHLPRQHEPASRCRHDRLRLLGADCDRGLQGDLGTVPVHVTVGGPAVAGRAHRRRCWATTAPLRSRSVSAASNGGWSSR